MKRTILTFIGLYLLSIPVMSQSNWGLRSSIGVEKKIAKGFDAEVEAKYYQTDNFRNTDRWSMGVSLSKRLYRNEAKTFNVRASLGYKYLNVYNSWSTKYKGDTEGIENGLDPQYYINNGYSFNLNNSYADSRHRFTASLQAAVELGRFKLSLRESYQYTHTDSAEYVKDKYRVNNDIWTINSEPDMKSSSNSQKLRSKITLDYDIPHWKYDPFVSYELFNGIDKGFKTEKSRITAGVDFSFNKKHNFEVAYMWQNEHDDDEPAGSFICLSYKFDF
ncbi:MAG: DUF2490 domain-containing protein [Bacteroidaceae bacterium]|nr:DUF2490 domain-containing protein [Bacteroidaceae bacterium]